MTNNFGALFREEYNQLHTNRINRFTKEFSVEYCNATGEINWKKLVKYNSATTLFDAKLTVCVSMVHLKVTFVRDDRAFHIP